MSGRTRLKCEVVLVLRPQLKVCGTNEKF